MPFGMIMGVVQCSFFAIWACQKVAADGKKNANYCFSIKNNDYIYSRNNKYIHCAVEKLRNTHHKKPELRIN